MTLILFCHMYFIPDTECKLLCIFQNCFCFSNPVAHFTDLQAKNALLQCYSSSDRKTGVLPVQKPELLLPKALRRNSMS